MCRSIKRLREGTALAGEDEVRAASLQFVRKVTGFQHPSARHQHAYDHAIDEISDSVTRLLNEVVVTMGSKTSA